MDNEYRTAKENCWEMHHLLDLVPPLIHFVVINSFLFITGENGRSKANWACSLHRQSLSNTENRIETNAWYDSM